MTDPAHRHRHGLPEGTVLAARPELGGARSTPAFGLPPDASSGLPGPLGTTHIGTRLFAWGACTYVMGIINVTPDSFSGDGLLARAGPAAPGRAGAGPAATDRAGAGPAATDRAGAGRAATDRAGAGPAAAAVALASSMVEAGADIVDVGGESTRPGHAVVDIADEIARVVPVVRAVREALPDTPISVDTTKPAVAAAALEAGADLVNDVWGVADEDTLARLAADHGVPIVLMHNRAEARYANLIPEIIGDLQRAIERTLRAGVAWDDILIDPGFGFGKTADHNLALLRELRTLAILGRPIVLGTSRKSTLGRVLDLPADQRLEATLATTALGIAAGADIVRVHDVRENVRAARMADAVVRGIWPEEPR
ncbi:MAG: dihydropteroate synthase [Chloroflexota bacterium]